MSIYTDTMERVEKQDKLADQVENYLCSRDYEEIETGRDDARGYYSIKNCGKLQIYICEEIGTTTRETASELLTDMLVAIRTIENMFKIEGCEAKIKILQQHIEGIPFIDAKIVCDI